MKESLQQAKEAVAAKDFKGALAVAESARARLADDYVEASKFAKIILKIPAEELGAVKIRLALPSSSSTVFFEPILKLFGALEGFDIEVKAGDFGNWRQDILNADSWLYKFEPDFVAIASNWRDANLPAFSEDPSSAADAVVAEFAGYWDILKSRCGAVVFQQNFDVPTFDSCGFLSQTSPKSRVQVLRRAAVKMVDAAFSRGVVCIDMQGLRAELGAEKWEDARMWAHGKQHPSPAALPRLAAEYVRAVKAVRGMSKKVCVVDLDNTLWGGVVGEDGLDGIVLGAPDADGEAYAEFQKKLLELKGRGILLAACSKNNAADAVLPFEKHSAMLLKLEDFISFKANWNAKSQNIADIARELGLGLDAFVFFDDNPAEIREVSAALPQVECVLLSADVSERVKQLLGGNYFDSVSVSDDDIQRHKAYEGNIARANAKSLSADADGFLKSLEMRCDVCDIGAPVVARAAQLLGKTNQFNLTTRRHSAEKIMRMSALENAYARCFRLVDKFGDNGVVGVLIALPSADGALEVDSFVMSCRVIGRGLENLMINDLFDFAQARGFSKIRGVYIPTPKNGQTKDLYERLGFAKESELGEGASSFCAALPARHLPHFIAVPRR